MATFGERFRLLRNELNISQKQLIEDFNTKYHYNLSDSAVSQYENNFRIPEIETLKYFAQYFNVSLDFLLGISNIRNFEEYTSLANSNRIIKIPVIKNIDIEEPILNYLNRSGYMFINENQISTGSYFYTKVIDNYMYSARILNNDMVLIKEQSNVSTGDIAALLTSNRCITLRRVAEIKGSVFFLSENSADNSFLTSSDLESQSIKIIGKVIHVIFQI